MTDRPKEESQSFMDWLQDLVDKDPEARLAAEEEGLRLYLSAALREAREARGMTQELVADAAGLTQSMVSRLERADYNPTAQSILRYVRALDADLVLSIVVDGRAHAATDAARRTVVVPQALVDEVTARGADLQTHVLNCVANAQSMDEMRDFMRDEMHN